MSAIFHGWGRVDDGDLRERGRQSRDQCALKASCASGCVMAVLLLSRDGRVLTRAIRDTDQVLTKCRVFKDACRQARDTGRKEPAGGRDPGQRKPSHKSRG